MTFGPCEGCGATYTHCCRDPRPCCPECNHALVGLMAAPACIGYAAYRCECTGILLVGTIDGAEDVIAHIVPMCAAFDAQDFHASTIAEWLGAHATPVPIGLALLAELVGGTKERPQ